MDHKVLLVDIKFLDIRKPFVVKFSVEVQHAQGHSVLVAVLLLAVGGSDQEPGGDYHSGAGPDVNILNMGVTLAHISDLRTLGNLEWTPCICFTR